MVHADTPEPSEASRERGSARGWSLDLKPAGRGWLVAAVTMVAVLAPSQALAGSYDPAADTGYSMFHTTQYLGAAAWWDAGYTGKGIGVAVIDSGVSPVDGLAGRGKIVYGPDLSLESQAEDLTNLDTYGHGTFMAGLIAGHDADLDAPYADAPGSAYRGIAPDARIVSIKVATADGGADVTQVIAAIDWAVQHRNDDGLNIRVINLSYGTNSRQPYEIDPLAYAAEQAWKAGVVVVAAAGNTGYQRSWGAPGLADPAYDPYVIGVGASDANGTDEITDDSVADYSAGSSCLRCKNPDFIAPGSHLQGLRVPNSYVDSQNPPGLLDARYMRGSGTSEAAAVTSGAVALILDRFPNLTPDRVKRYLADGAVRVGGKGARAEGAGEIQLGSMLTTDPADASQSFEDANGLGSVELARGRDHVSRDGVVLTGPRDIFGRWVSSALIARFEAAGSSWSGGQWNGSSWSGSSWSGSSWSGRTWSGSSWSGSSWSGSSWSGSSWSGSSWSGSSWRGSSWSGSSWSGNSWSSASWSTANWD